jgi:hypothetical protein
MKTKLSYFGSDSEVSQRLGLKISGIKNTCVQLTMFDEPLGGHGHIRTLIGDWAEDLTAWFFNGIRRKTDSRCDYCPDVSVSGGFIECKAAGQTRQTFVYSGRLDRDWVFSQSHRLWYCIWHHDVKTKSFDFVSELLRAFIVSLKAVYVVPFWAFYSVARSRPCVRLNSKYGGSDKNPTYGAGYRVNLSNLNDWKIEL